MGAGAGIISLIAAADSQLHAERRARDDKKARGRAQDTLDRRRKRERRDEAAARHRQRTQTLLSDRRANAGALVGSTTPFTGDAPGSLLGG